MTKVIHVHLIHGRKNYYFGSISAIYTVLTEDEVGIKKTRCYTPDWLTEA